MVVSIRPQAPVSTSLNSLVKGFILTQCTDCRSPKTIEYYDGILKRFLWYVEQQNWSDNARLITEWYIREFLGYVSSDINRWGVKGNGSESPFLYCDCTFQAIVTLTLTLYISSQSLGLSL